VAAGEFPSLHDAQVAIAREHGLPSWAALKQEVGQEQESHALDQVRWIISRFAKAGDAQWAAPTSDELSLHFDDHFLAAIPPPALIQAISKVAADLRDGELAVIGQTPVQAYVELTGMRYIAVAEAEPPHRLTGLRVLPIGSRVHDPRVTEPAPVRTQGPVPAGIKEIAEQAAAELGLDFTGYSMVGWSGGDDLLLIRPGLACNMPTGDALTQGGDDGFFFVDYPDQGTPEERARVIAGWLPYLNFEFYAALHLEPLDPAGTLDEVTLALRAALKRRSTCYRYTAASGGPRCRSPLTAGPEAG
jgi:hypothetical protein